ncbi:hypothetical protein [Nostoc sp.]|uniref:hypothetical protein n=1 Tax=Nostoc sp. TaxID=1180 RepID=UPI002FF2397B
MPKFFFLLTGFVVKALTLKIEPKKAFTKKAKVKSKKALIKKNGQEQVNLFMERSKNICYSPRSRWASTRHDML